MVSVCGSGRDCMIGCGTARKGVTCCHVRGAWVGSLTQLMCKMC